jgi:LysR family hydrogen peroxide-inducible transcriptional activator
MARLPTLRQLSYLIALHEERHFGRAAEASHVSQSTLSAAIRELERLLDAHIVDRSRRAVQFTPLGEALVAKARGVIQGAVGLTELVRSQRAPLTGTLRLGVIPTIAPYLLPATLAPLRCDYPKLELHLMENFSHVICADLEAGNLDLVLLALPFECGDVDSFELLEDPFYVAIPSSLADKFGNTVNVFELDPKDLLLMEEGHCLRDHALEACNLAGQGAGASILGTSLHTLIQMVDNGLGITLIPEMAVRGGLLKGTSVVVRPLASESTASRRIGLVWRRGSPMAEEFRLFGRALVEAYESTVEMAVVAG